MIQSSVRRFAAGLLSPLLLFHFTLPCIAGPENKQAEFVASAVASTLRKAEQVFGFSGIVLAEYRGEILAVIAVGSRDGNAEHPITEDTLFELGSVTKSFTAATCLVLEQQGKLTIDDSISLHLPGVPESCRPIEVQHLLRHTSGIPGTNYGPYSNDIELLTPIFLKGGPTSPPGTKFEYWNQGYALLSAVIEKSSGKTYTDTVRELVFQPAGMTTACFTGDTIADAKHVAIGQSETGKDRSALEPPYGDFYGLQYRGMGGVVANVRDLHKFIQTIRSAQFLDEARREKLLTTGPTDYAIGWKVKYVGDAQQRVFHSGAVRGFLTSVTWYPGEDSSLIIMANSDNKRSFIEVEQALVTILERQLLRTPQDQQFTAEERKTLAGTFSGKIPNGRTLTISITESDSDKLDVSIDWGGGLKSQGVLAKRGKNQFSHLDVTGSVVPLETHSADGKPVDRISMFDASFNRNQQSVPSECRAQNETTKAEQ